MKTTMGGAGKPWWERRWVLALVLIGSVLPLLYPAIPPLIDLPGHMGRYRIEIDALNGVPSPFYAFQWQLSGNLGIDLLIVPIAKIFGLELGTKLIVLAIPMLTTIGLLWISREVHGRIVPTVLFGLPFAYGHPFIFGFVNYTLSMALALVAFALWLRLERLGHYRLRALVFVIIAPLIWLCHIYGWGTLCLLAASAEIVHQHDRHKRWVPALRDAALNGLSLTPPLLLMVAWRSGHVGGEVGPWPTFANLPIIVQTKTSWYAETLRDHWELFDRAMVAFATLMLVVPILEKWLSYSRNLAASALILLIVFLAMPYVVFGSAYADMRLTPYIFMIAFAGIRFRPQAKPVQRSVAALVALAFFAVRTGATTVSFYQHAVADNKALGALEHVPPGARLVTFVGRTCLTAWHTNHMEHLPALAIVRRHAFSNDQWEMPGAQLMRSTFPNVNKRTDPITYHYGRDPSQMATPFGCRSRIWATLDSSLLYLPRERFDYVWIIDPPLYHYKLLRGMTLVWHDGNNALYRIDDHRRLKTL